MASRRWTNHLTCVNCRTLVHWTIFQCPVCGRNPREKESMFRRSMSDQGSPKPHSERRRHPRFEVQGKVILNRCIMGELIDLSQQGARLKAGLQLFRDQIVILDFAIKGIPIRVRARVIHVKKGVLDDRFTLGVHFETMATGHSEVLHNHLHMIGARKSTSPCFA